MSRLLLATRSVTPQPPGRRRIAARCGSPAARLCSSGGKPPDPPCLPKPARPRAERPRGRPGHEHCRFGSGGTWHRRGHRRAGHRGDQRRGSPASGDLEVRRLLPLRQRRSVGAWCFVDHYGPMSVDGVAGMQVPPHPHIGLQTVTWLIAGNVLHRDSLGSEQMIRPGQLNLMTAGRGIAHAEESPADHDPGCTGSSSGWRCPTRTGRPPRPSSTTRSCRGAGAAASRSPCSPGRWPASAPRPRCSPPSSARSSRAQRTRVAPSRWRRVTST